jgi:hypothetical protein
MGTRSEWQSNSGAKDVDVLLHHLLNNCYWPFAVLGERQKTAKSGRCARAFLSNLVCSYL